MTLEEIERAFQYNMTEAFIKWDKAINAEYKEENEEAFYQGAYAAQKYLIEKACKWLENNTNWNLNYYGGNNPNKGKIEDFRKAMEE
jgi:hypothetical protein